MIKPMHFSWAMSFILCMPAVSYGQSANEPESTETIEPIEQFVITARRRDETLTDVPLSVSAFNNQMITDARIDRPADFIDLSPNIIINESQNAGTSFITIRGVSQVRNGEPPVAVVVDGVLQVNAAQFTQELVDIESIEVVRGPQGALYGRNATGGAIVINTQTPSNELSGKVRAGVGRGNEYLGQASVSGAIIEDRLYFRLGGRYVERDGYFDNVVLDDKVDPFKDLALRGRLVWDASDRLTFDLRGALSRTDGGGLNFTFQPAIVGPDGRPTGFDFARGDANQVDRDFFANNLGDNDRDIDELALKVDYDADWATFTLIGSWNRIEEGVTGDQPPYTAASSINPFEGFPFADGTQTQFLDVEAFSGELRIVSPDDKRVRWLAGAYVLSTDRFLSTTTGEDREQGVRLVERDPFFGDPNNPTLTFLADDNDNLAWAFFGNVDVDITDRLTFSASGRYDRDRREQTVSDFNTTGLPGVGVPGAVNTRTFDKFQPQVSLSYDVTDDVLAYVSWGQGFRSGQFNQNGVGAVAATVGLLGVDDVVDQEETSTTEIGFNGAFFGNRLSFSSAAFRTRVDGQQYFVFIGEVGAQVLVNIDEVEIFGGELEVRAQPISGLDVYASIGVTDSEIKSYAVDPSAVGNEAPYVPNVGANLGAQYRTPALIGDVGLFMRADYERRGRQFWDPQNTTARSALDLVTVRFGFEDVDGRWSLIGTVDNLTDEVFNSEFVLGGFAHAGAPRVWRIDAQYNF